MFIECQDGTYLNTDKAVAYNAVEFEAQWLVCAVIESDVWYLGKYTSEDRAKGECEKIIFWIRSMSALEPSDSAYLSKFIYRMPKDG